MTMVDSLWGGSMEVYEIMTMVDSLWGGFMEVYERCTSSSRDLYYWLIM